MILFRGKHKRRRFCTSFIIGGIASLYTVWALSSPTQEGLTRQILNFYQEVRCPVCRGQSIADSDTPEAIALKQFIFKEFSKGESVNILRAKLRKTYGENILFEPPLTSKTSVLWLGPFVLLLIICLLGGYKLLKAYRHMS